MSATHWQSKGAPLPLVYGFNHVSTISHSVIGVALSREQPFRKVQFILDGWHKAIMVDGQQLEILVFQGNKKCHYSLCARLEWTRTEKQV